jgi:phage tail sheath protein FI
MGRSDASTDQVWFAPAGFNRGGISEGQINLQVGGVTQQLNRDDRDDLYEVDINPIANFTQEGIVVFGQKTLLADPSALDRINVRRMLIYVKKQVRLIANGILFDQNVEDTWNRFRNETEAFLRGVQNNLGISEYLVKLDNTTTTPDLIDQNVLYAKVYIKPARAIEFIALDFVITRTDADFSTY